MTLLDILVKLRLDKESFSSELKEATREAEDAGREIEDAGNKGGEGFGNKLVNKISVFGSKMGEVGTKVSTVGRGLQEFGRDASLVGQGLTNSITKPAVSAAKALAGVVLSKGWARLSTLDQAKAKLKAMNFTAEDTVEIMDTIGKVVEPTKYSMAEMADAASMALGSGVKKGDLDKYITSVADAATFANVSLGEMSSIYGKVASNGKLTTEVVQQMADRSIPIWQWLQDSTGKSMEEVRKAVSDGTLTLEDFEKAVDQAIGGASATMGASTLNGALDSTVAYIGRIGEKFLGASDDANTFAGQVLPLITSFNEWLVTAGDKAAEFGAIFGEVFGSVVEYIKTGQVDLDSMSGSAQTLFGIVQPFIDAIQSIINVGKTLVEVLGPETIAKIVAAALLAGPIISIIGGIVGGIGTLLTVGGTLITGIGKLMSIGSMLVQGIGVLVGVIGAPGVAFLAVAAVIMGAALLIYKNWDKIKAKASELKNKLSSEWGRIKSNASSQWNSIKQSIITPFQNAYDKVKGFVDKIKGFFPLKIGKIFSGLKLPHFSISGGQAPFGIGGKGSLPSFNVSWYRKAEDNPYVFKKATFFGAGEGSQDEMLYGRNALMKDIKEATKDNKSGDVFNFNMAYDASDDANDLLRDFARGVQRYRMAGAI